MQTQALGRMRIPAQGCVGLLVVGTIILVQGCSSHSRGLGTTGGAQGGTVGAGGAGGSHVPTGGQSSAGGGSLGGGAATSGGGVGSGGTTTSGGRVGGSTVAAGGTSGAGAALAFGGAVAAGGTTATTTSSLAGIPSPVTLERSMDTFGFCIEQGQFSKAVIQPDVATGALMLTGSIHRELDGGTGKDDPVGPIALTNDQNVRLRALIAALPPATTCPGNRTPCDTCLATTITIGANRYVDKTCESCSGVIPLAGFIDSLGSQGPVTPGLDGGRDLAEAASRDRASSPDAGGPDLDRDAPIPGPDAP